MSLKSGFSIVGAGESPSIERKLPHHVESLGWGSSAKVLTGCVLPEWEDADCHGSLYSRHNGPTRIVYLAPLPILYHTVALCCNEITDDPMRQSPTIRVSIHAPARQRPSI